MSRGYHWFVLAHEPTGVPQALCVSWYPPSKGEIEVRLQSMCEPFHVIVQGRIGKGEKRKRGVWQYNPKDKKFLYFSCPYCGAIGMSYAHVGSGCRDSVFCPSKSCGRHLSLLYFKKVEDLHGKKL